MTTFLDNGGRHAAACMTLLMFAASGLCSAQTESGLDEQPARVTAPMPGTAPGPDVTAMPRSRRVLTVDQFATLAGQTVSLSVRDRWPRRTVEGTILGVNTDTVTVDMGRAISTLPIGRTVVTSGLPGDFIDLIGRRITVTGQRRFPPAEITGLVVSVDASHVNIDSDGQLHRVPIASSTILSRTPNRHRLTAVLAGVAGYIGMQLWAARKCRNGGC